MSDQPKHETKNCPRCDSEFECKSGSILLCQCQTVVLSSVQMEFISAEHDDCLCLSCLQILRSEFNNRKHKLKLHNS